MLLRDHVYHEGKSVATLGPDDIALCIDYICKRRKVIVLSANPAEHSTIH